MHMELCLLCSGTLHHTVGESSQTASSTPHEAMFSNATTAVVSDRASMLVIAFIYRLPLGIDHWAGLLSCVAAV